ncbi:MAG TPA: protein kinase [Thermoanaerobaculia bacterium]
MIASGSRLGPYEILAPLGAGGMGEVYKARDTRLERTVAVKVLPQGLSSSAEVRQRFEREARTISQLSHPHICALYDVGREGETEYLVMEYLEGETLSDRLAKGPLPLEQTMRYGIEIADALDKAHRQGIVHRDLKPGNVMLTKSGVKLLDFGLAKAVAPSTPQQLTSFPTQQALTQEGTILGTFQYMAPEQLEGRDADARTDIFAFGAVLHEMATGKKAFSGASQASLISSIMGSEPPAVSTVSPMTPPAFDRIVRTCLAKDPEERWQSAADIKRELQWVAEGSQEVSTAASRTIRRSWIPWAIAAVMTVAAAALAVRSLRSASPERLHLSIVPLESSVLTEFFELSPDGRNLAFIAYGGGKCLVRVRDLRSGEIRDLPGTDGAETVFWSPDGRSLGFVARGKLRSIALATGSIDVLCDASAGRGGDWGPKGDILFPQKAVGAIYRVPSSGGTAVAATALEKGDLLHRWPQFLPDGSRFLYFAKTDRAETTGTYLATVGKPGRKLVLRNGATGVFFASDLLVYVRGGSLLAQHIDSGRGELTGEPEIVTRSVLRGNLGSFRDLFSVSDSGVIVLQAGSADRRLTWVDRRGKVLKTVGSPASILTVSLSPDERQAGFTVRSVETGADSVFIAELDRDVVTPLVENGFLPTWTPDGSAIFYDHRSAPRELRRRAMRGDPRDEPTGLTGAFTNPNSISPDGRYLLFSKFDRNHDIGVLDLQGDRKPQMLIATEFAEAVPHFSPDGRWFVYSSDELGEPEIFVRRFPMTNEKWRISTSGGQQPSWSADGKEIFYVALDDNLMAARVSTGASFSSAPPEALFPTTLALNNPTANQYAASADGQRFLMAVPTRGIDSRIFQVLMNWKKNE